MGRISESLKKAVRTAGFEVHRLGHGMDTVPVEFSKAERDILSYVTSRGLTVAGQPRVIATINACKHAVLSEIPGDFVECGVLGGGMALAAKMTFELHRSPKAVYLFDTFAGMTAPTEHDTSPYEKVASDKQFEGFRSGDRSNWCYASLDDVRSSFGEAGVDMAGVRFVVGDVMKTLRDEQNLPEAISVLRLDTDFYDSTKAEMEVLYPLLSPRGSLLLDDFGYWDGMRKAVVEYLDRLPPQERPLLHVTDTAGRMGVKP